VEPLDAENEKLEKVWLELVHDDPHLAEYLDRDP